MSLLPLDTSLCSSCLCSLSHNIHHYARANTKLRQQKQMLHSTQASLDNLELFNVQKLPLLHITQALLSYRFSCDLKYFNFISPCQCLNPPPTPPRKCGPHRAFQPGVQGLTSYIWSFSAIFTIERLSAHHPLARSPAVAARLALIRSSRLRQRRHL